MTPEPNNTIAQGPGSLQIHVPGTAVLDGPQGNHPTAFTMAGRGDPGPHGCFRLVRGRSQSSLPPRTDGSARRARR